MSEFSKKILGIIEKAKKEAIRLDNNYVGSEHLLLAILSLEKSNAVEILDNIGINIDELINSIEDTSRGSSETAMKGNIPLTSQSERILRNSFTEAKETNSKVINDEHLLLAILKDSDCLGSEILISYGIDYHAIKRQVLNPIFKGKKNDRKLKKVSKTPALDHFSRDITTKAKNDELDPVIGRDIEIERVAQILSRRKKNNPVLIGEPGVGKTAIVEGLAIRIINRQVPRLLYNMRLVALDLAGIVAGTKYRGQFEERMKTITMELENADDIILFIDELHTIIGAGGAGGSLDASNMFKPALARGSIQCIGATTLDEYRKFIEKDGALERRFQKIIVNPPKKNETHKILLGLRSKYEEHHYVKYSDKALWTAVEFSDRYISDKFLPDKAIDVLDEAGAKVHLREVVVPANIIALESELDNITLQKEQVVKEQNFEKAAELRDRERKILSDIEDEKKKWEQNSKDNKIHVNEDDIADVVAMMTGIPVNKVAESENKKLLRLEDELKKYIIGQDEIITTICRAIRRARAGLKNPGRPIGAFLFLGPTGVGKTELAKVISRVLFDSNDALIKVDMSDFMEKFSVSRLIGAPPGYVGYEEGGELTERVRRKPYSVVLFDEIEKAHHDIYNILLQIFDEGILTDSYGRKVDFKNTIIIMTSNTGTKKLQNNSFGFSSEYEDKSYDKMKKNILKNLNNVFNPEFLNRIDDPLVFNNLTHKDLLTIIDMQIKDISKNLESAGASLKWNLDVSELILSQGYKFGFGARPLRRTLQAIIEDPIAEKILNGQLNREQTIEISKKNKDLIFHNINEKKLDKIQNN